MYRVFRNGDELFTEDAPFSDLIPGDIICFRNHRADTVVHRIISRTETQITTQGDNNPLPDAPVDADHYLGRVASFRRGKIILPAANGKEGMRRFRINQRKRAILSAIRMMGCRNRKFFESAPLRIGAKIFPPELARFNETLIALRGKRVIAEKQPGKPWYVRGIWKLIYPLSLLEAMEKNSTSDNNTIN